MANQKKQKAETDQPKLSGERIALSLERSGGYWAAVVYKIKDGTIYAREEAEPTLRVAAIERFKILAARLLFGAKG